jgi:hypothetical protein
MTYKLNKEIERAAELVRTECTKEFVRAYEEAGIKGLCEDGRIEYAVDSVRSLNLQKLLVQIQSSGNQN